MVCRSSLKQKKAGAFRGVILPLRSPSQSGPCSGFQVFVRKHKRPCLGLTRTYGADLVVCSQEASRLLLLQR